jgi:hypothetical protein
LSHTGIISFSAYIEIKLGFVKFVAIKRGTGKTNIFSPLVFFVVVAGICEPYPKSGIGKIWIPGSVDTF